jgi:hypothetical protein
MDRRKAYCMVDSKALRTNGTARLALLPRASEHKPLYTEVQTRHYYWAVVVIGWHDHFCLERSRCPLPGTV